MTGDIVLGQNLYVLDALEEHVGQVIRQLPLRGPDGRYLIGDEELRTTTLTAQSGAKMLWKLCCAARAEIVRRIAERAADSTSVAREIAREAGEEGVSVRTFKRDAAVGAAFGPLFAEADTAPDLDRQFYAVSLHSPDPVAALQVAQQHKDADPRYSARDFESYIAATRMVSPCEGYGEEYVGRAALAFIMPYWDMGVLEATEQALNLPLRRWLLPDSIILIRVPPRALDLACRIMNAHEACYQQAFFLPTPPFKDGTTWHTTEVLLAGTRGHLRLPEGIPGEWRDPKIDRCVDLHFAFARPKLAIYPRCGMGLGEGWVTPEGLPSHVR